MDSTASPSLSKMSTTTRSRGNRKAIPCFGEAQLQEVVVLRQDSLHSTSVIGMSFSSFLISFISATISRPIILIARNGFPRFVRMTSDTSDANRTVVFANPQGSDRYVQVKVPVGALNEDIMDVAFTKAVGCVNYPTGCDGMQRDHRFAEAVQLGEHWRHKYLVDLDGMGYSARFFAFLASESAVIKATVYREFYSDWIQPW